MASQACIAYQRISEKASIFSTSERQRKAALSETAVNVDDGLFLYRCQKYSGHLNYSQSKLAKTF